MSAILRHYAAMLPPLADADHFLRTIIDADAITMPPLRR